MPQQNKDIRRWLAHRIVYQGKEYTMSVLTLAPDGTVESIRPFTGETHSTAFHSGTITITPTTLLFE